MSNASEAMIAGILRIRELDKEVADLQAKYAALKASHDELVAMIKALQEAGEGLKKTLIKTETSYDALRASQTKLVEALKAILNDMNTVIQLWQNNKLPECFNYDSHFQVEQALKEAEKIGE